MSDIQTIRSQLGLSQAEMAEQLGLHQSTISRFERGDLIPDKRTLIAVRALASKPRRARKSPEAA
ncbi:helix-turn-helix domain-containing protein [Novosphingobium sp. FSY-8]|uniref:Helix-turn-helix domain-containing protein n=1 Tax=Novosphingobium ovatum TaxID=1908523 RepID=A0ABW9XFR6_9SPHN|nr:helix-turn-helix transcriptional regulator [Novosphingobium ovatum]NBC37339.1 helix-turn-helix domain-containing protein [Novosphingobium ovatum]